MAETLKLFDKQHEKGHQCLAKLVRFCTHLCHLPLFHFTNSRTSLEDGHGPRNEPAYP